MTPEEISELVNGHRWYHSYEVLPGLMTPGRHVTDAVAIYNDRFHLPEDLTGLRALDIGALDGPYSFELERRGADVVSVDIQDPDTTGFNIAKKVRDSKIEYIQGSVYELSRLVHGKFDLIAYFGVWYHLKHPSVAFDEIAKVLSDDGKLLVEGECLLGYAPDPTGRESETGFVREMADSDIPIALFYAGKYKKDQWSWYVPNRACVEEWLRASGFELTDCGFWDDHPHQRMYGTARKVPDLEIEEDNPVW